MFDFFIFPWKCSRSGFKIQIDEVDRGAFPQSVPSEIIPNIMGVSYVIFRSRLGSEKPNTSTLLTLRDCHLERPAIMADASNIASLWRQFHLMMSLSLGNHGDCQ